jgi:hypothetical protein
MSADQLDSFLEGPALAKKAMDELDERTWKWLFVERLAELFVNNGLDGHAAITDAYAHSNDCYPRRNGGDPKSEAEIIHRELKADTF